MRYHKKSCFLQSHHIPSSIQRIQLQIKDQSKIQRSKCWQGKASTSKKPFWKILDTSLSFHKIIAVSWQQNFFHLGHSSWSYWTWKWGYKWSGSMPINIHQQDLGWIGLRESESDSKLISPSKTSNIWILMCSVLICYKKAMMIQTNGI